jgi:hypothetical protein
LRSGGWLLNHPDVLAALDTTGELEPFAMEDYMATPSVAWEVLFTWPDERSDPSYYGDRVLIRRRLA